MLTVLCSEVFDISSFTSQRSTGSIGHVLTGIHFSGMKTQTSFYPFVPHDIAGPTCGNFVQEHGLLASHQHLPCRQQTLLFRAHGSMLAACNASCHRLQGRLVVAACAKAPHGLKEASTLAVTAPQGSCRQSAVSGFKVSIGPS